MIIKLTNQCAMACTHCLEDSRPRTGQHMAWETFEAALSFTERVEDLARASTGYNLVLLSGGECTEHPRILDAIDRVVAGGRQPVLISNGLWLGDDGLREEILARPVLVQVTNDARFYPQRPPTVESPKVTYVDALTIHHKLGRGAGLRDWQGVPERRGPSSFNFRSVVRSYGDVRLALVELRARALTGRGGHCTPSVSHDGVVVAGESRMCGRVGTVDSSPEEITRGVLDMGACDRCGLERGLSAAHRQAIGLSP